MSFTTTATASAAGPAIWAVATTCPTSCTPAPTQWPNCEIAEAERMPQRGQHCDGQGSAQGDQCDGRGLLVVAGLDDAAHRPDGRGAADGEPARHQQRLVAGEAERAAEPERAGERQHDDEHSRGDRQGAEPGDVAEAELEAEQHDADAEQPARGDAQARARGRPSSRARVTGS